MSYLLKINCLKFSTVAFFLLLIQTASAQANRKNVKELGTAKFQELDQLVQKNQKQLGNNLTVLVWTDTLVYKRELGEFDAKTLAPIGSASKWLTTALVMKFVEVGRISLDDKISKYLPIYDSYGKSYITIRHCLTHFTGIQSEGFLTKKNFASLQEEVDAFAKKEIKTNPGTEFSYSEIGIDIAGRILEIVSKKKFDMLIKQQLLNPLAMRKTTFGNLEGGAINPSNGAQSTAEEYLHFLQMLLNNGKYNGQQILSEASIAEMRKISTPSGPIKLAPKSTEGFNYALGSWVVEDDGKGNATSLVNPALFGTWPIVDWCRGYACIIFTKTLLGEQKKDLYLQMKAAVDGVLPSKCR